VGFLFVKKPFHVARRISPRMFSYRRRRAGSNLSMESLILAQSER